ncbi:MAG: 50S ribosomal protein L9 [Candidatus Omnitrophica bacterium]|nr:50S ribosomal protein L9 [Candidatus Omnitrophota bacterium]
MKVILLDDIEKMGSLGDVVEVKKGFARNFLFPRKLAIEALDKNLKVLEERKRKRAQQIAKVKQETVELGKKISGISCTIPMTAGEEDKLFGSVTTELVAEALAAEGVNIDKKQITLPESIRKLGVYQVEVRLDPEVTVSTKIWVVKK